MIVRIVTPAPAGSTSGNRVTALRWAGILRGLGHRVRVAERYAGEPCDVLVALHARKSAAAVERLRAERPGTPVVVALTGTDLYDELPRSPGVGRTLAGAARLVVLQALGVQALPPELRARTRVLVQSARAPSPPPPPAPGFQACLLAHLRPVKGPLLAAAAARRLPPESRVRVVHVGAALEPAAGAAARAETAENPRYAWRGPVPRQEALRTLAASRLLLVTSELEGGANVVSEAIACGVPVLSTRIDGSVGLLGADYPGLFPVGDADALAALLVRAEVDPAFLPSLRAHVLALAPQVAPEREREGWRALLAELTAAATAAR